MLTALSPLSGLRRGFNLIESAIVLGVIGIVIGGIWIAAAAVSENLKTNRMMEGTLATINNVNNKFSISGHSTGPNIGLISDIGPVTTGISMGLVPTDWVQGSLVKHPFGGNVRLEIQANGGNPRALLRYLPPFGTSSCIKFSRQLLNATRSLYPSSTVSLTIATAPSGQSAFSWAPYTYDLDDLETLCGQGPGPDQLNMAIYFQLLNLH